MTLNTTTALERLRKPQNILVYGHPDAGKTVFGASAYLVPELRDVLVLEMAQGAASVAAHYPNVETREINSYDEALSVWRELYSGKHSYRTVVLDDTTEGAQANLAQIALKAFKTQNERTPREDALELRQGDYRKNTDAFRNLIRYFRQLPLWVITTAWAVEKTIGEGDDAREITRPAFTAKLQTDVAGHASMIGYLYPKRITEDGKRRNARLMLWNGHERIWAKDRTNAMPQVMVDPDMRKVYDLIQAKIKELENARPV